jgi:ATP-dependent helicase HepA
MLALEQQMFLHGVDAINGATQRLSAPEGIEREFRFIRNQDELDAIETASTGIAAELADKIGRYERECSELQTELERWLVDCLQFVRVGESAPGDSVLRYHFARPERGKRTLLPLSALQRWFMTAFDAEVDHPHFDPPLTHALTYGRETARLRRVGLARLGNPVIDAVSQHLLWDDRGTSFALWRRAEASHVGIYFRLDFIVETEVSALLNEADAHSSALRRQADAAFPPITETLWISRDLGEPEAETLALLQLPYRNPEDANVKAEHWPSVLKHLECDDWSGLCDSVRSVAEQVLRARHGLGDLTEQCALAFEAQCAAGQEQLRSRLAALPSTRSTEREQLEGELDRSARIAQLMAAGVRQPIVRLDAAGVVFLSDHKLKEISA